MLKVFDFSKRNLTEMPLISETSNFEYILDNNSITQIEEIPQTCAKLSLSNNKISFINSKLNQDLQLKYLDLSFNRIISLLGFEKFKSLEELNLSNNYIGDDQLVYLNNLYKLKNLNLSNNNIKSEEIKNTIYNLKLLQKINIANNNLTQIYFEKTNNLIELELDANKLITLQFGDEDISYNNFDYLMYLSANENKIQNISTINNLKNLEYLSLSSNEIKQINIYELKKLKFLQLKSNQIEAFCISENNQLLQHIDISFNNLSNFKILGKNNLLKNLLLDNNKLTNINFGFNNNTKEVEIENYFQNIELLDISFNLFYDANFLMIFKNLQKLNLSFNNLKNLLDLLNILKNFNKLKEVNLIENDFNKNIYNTDILNNNTFFNNVNEYLESPDVLGMYQQQLNSYRSCIIINLPKIFSLDNINITQEEKSQALKQSEYKLNTIDLKSSNFSIYKKKDIKFSTQSKNDGGDVFLSNNKNYDTISKNLNNISDYNNFNIDSISSKNFSENFNLNNINEQNDDIIYNNNNNNNYNNLINTTTKKYTINNNIKEDFNTNLTSTKKKVKEKQNNGGSENDVKNKIYKMLCQTLYNLCDNKGYIYFKYFLSLAEELVTEYNISSQLNEMTKEVRDLAKSSLLPGKFHIKDLLKIMQNSKYDNMFYTINKVYQKKPTSIISQSIHLSQCIKKKITNNENCDVNNNIIDKNKTNSINKSDKKTLNNNNLNINNLNNNIYNSNNKNKNYEILNTLRLKTPFLSTYAQNNQNFNNNTNNSNTINKNKLKQLSNKYPNSLNTGCFNILYQSCSELSKLPDLKNHLFLQNFIYFINHISFPIHFKEAEQSFIISISQNEKEYKFIQAFMTNFKMENFELNKWYCHNYYKQIFENYDSDEFVFEHNFLIFYSYYNEIIDNFFNDVYQVQDCYLMIEDNPLNLYGPNISQDTRIVMLILVRWKDCEISEDSKLIENVVFNKSDSKYYFKNPFNWIGNGKNEIYWKNKNNNRMNNTRGFENCNCGNSNILIPVYIFGNIIFNNDEMNEFL